MITSVPVCCFDLLPRIDVTAGQTPLGTTRPFITAIMTRTWTPQRRLHAGRRVYHKLYNCNVLPSWIRGSKVRTLPFRVHPVAVIGLLDSFSESLGVYLGLHTPRQIVGVTMMKPNATVFEPKMASMNSRGGFNNHFAMHKYQKEAVGHYLMHNPPDRHPTIWNSAGMMWFSDFSCLSPQHCVRT